MDEDEIVETSDAEELEQIQSARRTIQKARGYSFSPVVSPYSPRKRIKVSHNFDLPTSSPAPMTPISDYAQTSDALPASSQSSENLDLASLMSLTDGSSLQSNSRLTTPELAPREHPTLQVDSHQESLSFSGSQDPLLLHTQAFKGPTQDEYMDDFPASTPPSTEAMAFQSTDHPQSPDPSPTNSRYRSQSVDPLYMLSPLHTSSPSPKSLIPNELVADLPGDQNADDLRQDELTAESTLPESMRISCPSSQSPELHELTPGPPREQNEDDLLQFSPQKAPSPFLPSSPLPSATPSPAKHPRAMINSPSSPPQEIEHSPSPASPIVRPTEDENPVIPPDPDPGARYSLRAREARQVHPYAWDQAQYRRTLKDAPEAYIKVNLRRGEHHRHTHEDEYEDESQTQGYEPERGRNETAGSSSREELTRSRSGGSNGRVGTPAWIPEVLPDLPSSDEEERREMRALRKEGREQEKKERAAQRAANMHKKNKRSFPLSRQFLAGEAENAAEHRRSPSSEREHHTTEHRHSDRPASRLRSLSPGAPASEGNRGDNSWPPSPTVGDHLGDNMQMDVDDHDLPHTHSPPSYQNDDPIIVDDDVSDGGNRSTYTISDAEPEVEAGVEPKPIGDDINAKKMRALRRMMPASMANQHLRGKKAAPKQRAKQRQRSATVRSDSEGENEAPQPGRIIKRTAEEPDHLDAFRGDSESSDVEPSSPRVSENEATSLMTWESDGPSQRRERLPRSPPAPEVIEIFDSDESEHSSSEDEVDLSDHVFSYYNKTGFKRPGKGPRQRGEGNLIDYMLTKTRALGKSTTGKRRKGKTKKSRKAQVASGRPETASSSRRTLDIVTHGARKYGNERQLVLSFDKHHKAKSTRHDRQGLRPQHPQAKSHSRAASTSNPRSQSRSQSSTSCGAFDNDPGPSRVSHEPDENVYLVPEPQQSKKEMRIKKNKERRERLKNQGVYHFNSTGTNISTGRRKLITVPIRSSDDDFRQALVPLSQPTTRSFTVLHRAPKPVAVPRTSASDVVHQDIREVHVQHERQLDAEGNTLRGPALNIPCLPSGVTFGPSTYVGKGWLHELVELVLRPSATLVPSAFIALGFEFGPDTSTSTLTTSIVEVCSRALEVATALPDPDSEEQTKDWEGIFRVISRLVSWHLTSASDEAVALRDAVKAQILRLISTMHEASFNRSSMDMMSLNVCWFAVELSIRLGYRVVEKETLQSAGEGSLLVTSAILLIQYLLEYGPEQTIIPILKHDSRLNEPSMPLRTAELWICLVHIFDSCQGPAGGPSSLHTLWRIVHDVLLSGVLSVPKKNFEISENIWLTTFTLCALSQFSVHGMTTSHPRLPAAWDLVLSALGRVRLVLDLKADVGHSKGTLKRRDHYLGHIMFRCYHLRSRWHWPLGEAMSVFNLLSTIFRSRKFANLLHEPSDFPDFLNQSDLSLIDRDDPSDTAFVLFLKLIAQAAKDEGELSVKIRKLLSLAIPIGTLPFNKQNPPSYAQLSMLYNRFSATAVGIVVDPASYESRLVNIRKYTNFEESDIDTRTACIRGLVCFAQLLIPQQLSLDEAFIWLAEMVAVLLEELNETKSPTGPGAVHAPQSARMAAVLNMDLIIRSVAKMMDVYDRPDASSYGYPNAAFLGNFTRLFYNSTVIDDPKGTTKTQLVLLIQRFLAVRRMFVPRRPTTVTRSNATSNSESQEDYGAFDFDLDDPELLAVLNHEESPYKAREQEVSKLVKNHVARFMYRILCTSLHRPEVAHDSPEVESWIQTWIECAEILIQNTDTVWSHYLCSFSNMWMQMGDGYWRTYIELRVVHNVLKVDPSASRDPKSNQFFLEAMMVALIPAEVQIEHEYISLLLSNHDIEHPLLRGIADELGREIDMSKAEFLQFRGHILEMISANLATVLRENPEGEEGQIYVAHCIAMFRTMKRLYEFIQVKNDKDALADYGTFCRRVAQIFFDHPEIRSQSRLGHWSKIFQ